MSSAGDAAPGPTAGVLEELTGTLTAARAAVTHFLELASLEARRAGLALAWMIALGFAAALCVVTAWLGIMAALAMGAIALGMPPISAVLVLAVLNLAAGGALAYWCVGRSRDLLFPATRRQVAGTMPIPPSP